MIKWNYINIYLKKIAFEMALENLQRASVGSPAVLPLRHRSHCCYFVAGVFASLRFWLFPLRGVFLLRDSSDFYAAHLVDKQSG